MAEPTLPLVLKPSGAADIDTLLAQLSTMQDDLRRVGALLLRGWEVPDAPTFERIARAINPNLQNEYLGTSPRNALTPYVFTASELPGFYPIPQHCEMTFIRTPPHHLFFVCLVPNKSPGGETPLVDMRKVWQQLDPEVRGRFEARGVTVIRNYAGLGGSAWWDPWKLKPWSEMFGTTDRAVVEQKCAEQGFTPTWSANGRLRLVNTQPAMQPHPVTGEIAWFNHTQVFHRDAAPAEYARIAGRLGWKWHLWGWFAQSLLAAKSMFEAPENSAMHCTYGDGSAISKADLEALREAIWSNLVAIPWEKGDVVVIDNRSVAHGRLPYSGERLVAVAWA